MFTATKKLTTIVVSCENSIIEIQSVNRPSSNHKMSKAIAANEKTLLVGFLIDRKGKVTEEELMCYFRGRGWQIH